MSKRSPSRGMTIVEILAVVAVITILVGILLPALGSARRNALWTLSQSNMRQVGQLVISYAGDNRDYVVPTAFDNAPTDSSAEIARAGKVRSASPAGLQPPVGQLYQGSWSDILWTTGGFGPLALSDTDGTQWDYRFDSPDAALYQRGFEKDVIFRSAELMTKLPGGTGGPTPFGTGANNGSDETVPTESGQPGYFGGNPFFDARAANASRPWAGRYWTMGEIKSPATSMYLMDSNIGELLTVNDPTLNVDNPTLQLTGVDWRYPGGVTNCLFLDGRVDSFSEWDTLKELEKDFKVRVFGLDQRSFFPAP